MSTCPSCGRIEADGARFCGACGAALEETPEPVGVEVTIGGDRPTAATQAPAAVREHAVGQPVPEQEGAWHADLTARLLRLPILLGGLLYLVCSFRNWQQVSVGTFGTFGLNEWHGIGILAGSLVIALLVWEALRVLGLNVRSKEFVSVALALLLALVTVITFATHGTARHWPAWFGLLLAIGITIATVAVAASVRFLPKHVPPPAPVPRQPQLLRRAGIRIRVVLGACAGGTVLLGQSGFSSLAECRRFACQRSR